MTGFSLLGTAAILSTAIGSSSLAKIPIKEPVASAVKISSLLVALLLVSSLTTPTAARPRSNTVAVRAHLNVIEGRQIAAPPWSAACMSDQGPSECGEPMWIYGSRSEIARYRSAF